MKILLVQYAGDFLAAYRRRLESGTESYFGHGYFLDQLEQIANRFGPTTILCGNASQEYEEHLESGLTFAGTPLNPAKANRQFDALLERYDPTHLIVLGPLPSVIRWGVRSNRKILCMFADSFEVGALRLLLRHGRMGAVLRHPNVELVGNHGINSCLSVQKLGVSADKIVPWDWPHTRKPHTFLPKAHPGLGRYRLFYVGSLYAQKGIGDLITAVADLRRRDVPVLLDVAGSGEIEQFRSLSRALGISEVITFHGQLANNEVFDMMRAAFAVVVPSRHEYPEGLPLSIYEALSARTPLIASDHPMFRYNLVDGKDALIFRSKDIGDLAAKIQRLIESPQLYTTISEGSPEAWQRIQIDAKWGEILQHWISDAHVDRIWIGERMLSAERYDSARRTRII